MRFKLNLDIGNGYLDGDAANDSMSCKINIQQGWPDTILIVPSDLGINARQALITFDTEKGNQILVNPGIVISGIKKTVFPPQIWRSAF